MLSLKKSFKVLRKEERLKPHIVIDSMTIYVEIPIEYTRVTPALISNEINKIMLYKVDMQNQLYFYSNRK